MDWNSMANYTCIFNDLKACFRSGAYFCGFLFYIVLYSAFFVKFFIIYQYSATLFQNPG